MSNCISRLVQYVNTSLDGYCDKDEMDVVCASISVLYAIKKLAQAKNTICFDYHGKEYDRVKSLFGDLVSCYDYYISKLAPEKLTQLNNLIDDILTGNPADSNMVSWIYQQLKGSLAKEALKKIGSDKNKLTGTDMLVQTQFFTDNYMVKYLVDKVFEIQKDNLPNVVFIDPACGGGNFLTYIYKKLLDWYEAHTKYDINTINSLILSKNIVGYDLDANLSKIAALSLYICCRLRTGLTDITDIFVYGGIKDDVRGFLTQNVKSNDIAGMDISQLLSHIREQKAPIVYITNPPFMGKRDMDLRLKEYLLNYYPSSKGDLCFSFMEQVMQCMRSQDLFAAVTQNGWLALSTLKGFRKKLLDNFFLDTCVDMGANAFENINGEKTNIVLSVITGKSQQHCKDSTFVNLRGKNLAEKKSLLSNGQYKEYFVNMDIFRSNANYEFCYQLGNDIEQIKSMPLYGDYSKCMQGSSTGDNKTMVKYIWETNEPGWKLASKGGGYSKWGGLNYYRVKWGANGELLKSNKGSALRNPNEIENTALVYSDTGTLGLSTRYRIEGQVFIASGPGIKVLKGNPLCHQAFLNSKISTYFLKILNPKFTVSAGYISKIPVADSLLEDKFLALSAEKCIFLKQEYLSRKLPNYEFAHDNYAEILDVESYIEDAIIKDIFNQYRRYIYEQEIDKYILEKYQLSDVQKAEYDKMMGSNISYTGRMLNLRKIDKMLASTMNESCQSVSRKLNGFIVGTENCIDMISYMYSLPPKDVTRYLLYNASYLSITKKLYMRDLVHKIILKVSNITILSEVHVDSHLSIDVVLDRIKEHYPVLFKQLQISSELIKDILDNVHNKCFFNKPILQL